MQDVLTSLLKFYGNFERIPTTKRQLFRKSTKRGKASYDPVAPSSLAHAQAILWGLGAIMVRKDSLTPLVEDDFNISSVQKMHNWLLKTGILDYPVNGRCRWKHAPPGLKLDAVRFLVLHALQKDAIEVSDSAFMKHGLKGLTTPAHFGSSFDALKAAGLLKEAQREEYRKKHPWHGSSLK